MKARLRNSGIDVELGRDRELEVVAGDALVVGGRLDLVAAPARRVGGVHEEDAAAAAVLGRREVVGDRAARRRLDVAVGLRQDPEPVAHRGPGLGHRRLRRGDDLVAFVWCSDGSSRRRRRRSAARSPVPTTSGPSARYSAASDSTWPRPISWISWAVSDDRRVEADRRGVGLVAVGEPRQAAACRRGGLRQDLVAEHVAVRRQRRPDVALDDRARAGPATPRGRRRPCGVGGVEQRVLGDRRRRSQRSSWSIGLADREVGRRPAAGDALAVPVGEVAEVRRDAAELADHRLGDLGVGQRQLRDPDGRASPARRRSGRRRTRRGATRGGRPGPSRPRRSSRG